MTYFSSKDKKACFGCGACEQVCPVSAISMREDQEGFLYPVVAESCVHCGRCQRICPAAQQGTMKTPAQVIAAVNKDEDIRRKSASGGAFAAIVSACDEKTVIFGAKWEDRSKVCHASAPVSQALDLFQKSKYIQSNMGRSYSEVKEKLLQGQRVVFSGTPCQVAGLKNFLGSDYANLLCVDLVCHGVPSGKVLETYLRRKDRRKDPVAGIDFRTKKYTGSKWDSKFAEIRYQSGKKVTVDYDSSGFLRGFASGLFFRPSCGSCPFAQSKRVADLTIGDYWGVEKEIPFLDPHEGVSLILVNSEKGQQYLQNMAQYMQFYPTELEPAVNGNARLRKPDPGHKNRDLFFSKMDSTDFEQLVQKCVRRVSKLRKIGHKVKRLLRKG